GKLAERAGADHEDIEWFEGAHGRRARRGAQQGAFAEMIAGIERCHRRPRFVEVHAGRAALDHVEVVARLPLVKNVLPRLEMRAGEALRRLEIELHDVAREEKLP